MARSKTNEQLLKILKDYSDNVGFPKQRDFKPSNGLPSAGVYIKRFGSWNASKELAGIENSHIKIRKDKYNGEDVIIKFKQLYTNIGRVPNTQDILDSKFMPSIYVINKHFGGIDGLIEACGFESNYENGKYKPEFLISEIKRFKEQFKRTPTATDFDNLDGYPSRKTYSNHFMNFDEAIKLADLEVVGRGSFKLKVYPKTYGNKEYLVSEVYRFIEEFGYTPTIKEMDLNDDYPSRCHYRKTFGSWNNALEECGLELNSIQQYEDDFLESEFHRFVRTKGITPNIEDFNRSEYPSFWCYQQRFGSWSAAMSHYGYETYDEMYNIDKIKEFLEDLCSTIYLNENRTIITTKDIDSSGDRYSYGTCLSNLKKEGSSVREYVKLFGFEMLSNSCGLTHTFDDGETVLSQYEYELSAYLKRNNFVYNKDYSTENYYKDFIKNCSGMQRIDYIVNLNGRKIYIEVAGFLKKYKDNYYNNTEIKESSRCEEYRLKLMHKESMLKENNLEYYIIFPQDCNEEFFNTLFKWEDVDKCGEINSL